ncbi:rhodanese-related sulfurtransferase [Natronocella acetinitrilica]|jgi:rhodanese-related sulfurtransferase|uniref:Rhodanese-related sulfurtransferase n=1 Tax=Natronocella acetinitrilica TaxID=414046 RepID=A0AAE3KAC3_9GAMM|nr:rhodanese-like domain-containing protein [Natronocella acetinitrilica]MCP1673354.1 rhodanese-related sulfurtransferase [Natronocella acetinitrilica]
MERLPEFIANNWVLFLALAVIILWILTSEMTRFTFGLAQLDPGAATDKYNREDALFVDLRGEADFRKGHLPGAMHVLPSALDQKNRRLEKAKKKPVIVYCQNGMQSAKPGKQLKEQGFEQVFLLKGGFSGWEAANLPIERK